MITVRSKTFDNGQPFDVLSQIMATVLNATARGRCDEFSFSYQHDGWWDDDRGLMCTEYPFVALDGVTPIGTAQLKRFVTRDNMLVNGRRLPVGPVTLTVETVDDYAETWAKIAVAHLLVFEEQAYQAVTHMVRTCAEHVDQPAVLVIPETFTDRDAERLTELTPGGQLVVVNSLWWEANPGAYTDRIIIRTDAELDDKARQARAVVAQAALLESIDLPGGPQ